MLAIVIASGATFFVWVSFSGSMLEERIALRDKQIATLTAELDRATSTNDQLKEDIAAKDEALDKAQRLIGAFNKSCGRLSSTADSAISNLCRTIKANQHP